MAPFYGWGSTATRLEPLRGGSLIFSFYQPRMDERQLGHAVHLVHL